MSVSMQETVRGWQARARVGAAPLPTYDNTQDWGWTAQQAYATETAQRVNEQGQAATGLLVGLTAVVVGGIAMFFYTRNTRRIALANTQYISELAWVTLRSDLRNNVV